MGGHPEHLVALVGGDGHRAVVIANALDEAPPDAQRLRRDLAGAGVAWLRGGNVFMLRYALDRSGADTVFREGVAYRALHDGQALLVNGPDTAIV